MRQRCRVSCITGASNLYWLTVGQSLLSLQQVGVEGGMLFFVVVVFCFINFHSFSSFSSDPLFHFLYYLFCLSFSGRRHKMTHTGWRVVEPQHNHYYYCPLPFEKTDSNEIRSKFISLNSQIVLKQQEMYLCFCFWVAFHGQNTEMGTSHDL